MKINGDPPLNPGSAPFSTSKTNAPRADSPLKGVQVSKERSARLLQTTENSQRDPHSGVRKITLSDLNFLNEKLTTVIKDWSPDGVLTKTPIFKLPPQLVHARRLGQQVKSDNGVSVLRPNSLIQGSTAFGGRLPDIHIDKSAFDQLYALGQKHKAQIEAEQDDSFLPRSKSSIEAETISRIQEDIIRLFERFDYDGLKPTTENALANREFMTLSDFVGKGYGDCRHHAAALSIAMQGANVESPTLPTLEEQLNK